MKQRNVGYFLIVFGVLSFTFLSLYDGETFISRGLLTILIFILIGLGSFLIFVFHTISSPEPEQYDLNRLEHFIINGLEIPITIDNCRIKENNYREEILDESFANKYKLLDEIYDPIRNTEYRNVEQSVIVYEYSDGNSTTRMISRTFNFNANMLRLYINQGKITLLIDRSNKNQYMFRLD